MYPEASLGSVTQDVVSHGVTTSGPANNTPPHHGFYPNPPLLDLMGSTGMFVDFDYKCTKDIRRQ